MAIGPGADAVAEHAAKMGVSRAFAVAASISSVSDDPEHIASLCSESLRRTCDGGSYICLFSADPCGDAVAAMVGIDLGFECAGRLLGLDAQGDGLWLGRSAYGGRLQLATRLDSRSCTCVVQPVRGVVPAIGQAVAQVEALDISELAPEALATTIAPVDEEGFDLHSARLVFSGGRGMDEQGFACLAELAHTVDHAAVGASLPAVDLGLAPVSWQVGQSGKFVSPDIYLAVGLSGTPQHLAGVSKDSRIIAINSDPDAPIFNVAEVGIVADWKDVLPDLLTALRAEMAQ